MNAKIRIQVEIAIAAKAIDCALADGRAVTVYDDRSATRAVLKNSSDKAAILNAMFGRATATDENVLRFSRGGWVLFVYGNDGTDVISDYSVSLENLIAPANKFAEDIDSGAFHILPGSLLR